MNRQPLRFVDHLTLWIRWRWFLIGITLAAAVLTAALSFLLPKTYRASALVLPPKESSALVGLPILSGMDIDILGGNTVPAAGLLTLLKSSNLKERINRQVDLIDHYKAKDIEEAYRAFDDHLSSEIETQQGFGQSELISVSVYFLDRDPQFAAKALNALISEWDRLTIDLNQRGARLRREFVEEHLRQNNLDLVASQDSLRRFEEEHGLASIEGQVTGTVSTAMALERQITNARISVQVMEKLYQPDNPDLKRAQIRLDQLLQEERKIKSSDGSNGLLLPINTAPEISLQYARLYREAKMQEAINDILVQQYQQARYQEVNDIPPLRIVDRGVTPLHKFKPKRIILVIVAGMSSFFLAVILMYFFNYLEQIRGTEDYRWVEEILKELKTDRDRVRKLLRMN